MAGAYLKIVEQPAQKSFRFRYESEGRLSGCILGVNATPEIPSYPKIEIGNYIGDCMIFVSCVTHNDTPYRQHPHKLSSKNQVSDKSGGAYITKRMIQQSAVIEFKDIGIIFIKKADIKASLEIRKKTNIDPTAGGWNHIDQKQRFDLSCVRLCFQVLIRKQLHQPSSEATDWFSIGFAVTDPIMDKKSNGQLNIVEIMPNRSSIMGKERIAIFCDKVKREDITIVFYEQDAAKNVIWREEIDGKNQSVRVHHQYGISLNAPAYRNNTAKQESHKVWVQICRPSDHENSKPVPFHYFPIEYPLQSIQLRRKKLPKKDVKDVTNIYQQPHHPKHNKPVAANESPENVLIEVSERSEESSGSNESPCHHPIIDIENDKKENTPPIIAVSTYPAQSNVLPPQGESQYNAAVAASNQYPSYYYAHQINPFAESILPKSARPTYAFESHVGHQHPAQHPIQHAMDPGQLWESYNGYGMHQTNLNTNGNYMYNGIVDIPTNEHAAHMVNTTQRDNQDALEAPLGMSDFLEISEGTMDMLTKSMENIVKIKH